MGDWELTRLTGSGARGPFETLVERHERLLRFLILRRAAHLLRFADLEEIIDETWCTVLRRTLAGDFPASVRFTSWLTGICLNVLKQRPLRPEGGLPVFKAEDGSTQSVDLPGDAESPLDAANRAELLVALRDCLSERTERELRVYQFVYVEGMTKVDAAKELDCSEAYVRQKLLPRLHQALVRCLARKGFRDVSAADVI